MNDIDEQLRGIWEQIKALSKKHEVRPMFGEFRDIPEIVELWETYNSLAKKHGKRPLGWASPEGGWALSWVRKNCRFAAGYPARIRTLTLTSKG